MMWPFTLFGKSRTMTFTAIDERFASTGQIRPDAVAELAAQGYRAIICARPDHEDPGQPTFAEIAGEAKKHGMAAFHIPVSGRPTPAQQASFDAAMAEAPGPVLGYCRSGGRAGSLYAGMARKA